MQNNKQIVYFSSYDDIKNPHYGGGGATAIHEVAKRLSQRFDVRVLSWNHSGKIEEIIDKVHYERFGNPSLNPKIGMFVYQLSLPFIQARKQYALWFESFCPPFTAANLPLYTKKPVVGVVHMLAAEDMERKYKLPFHLIQNSNLKHYRNLIVMSDALKEKIQKISHGAHISIIGNGVPHVYQPMKKKQKYILFMGRIEIDQKGIDLLVEGFKQFVKTREKYTLVIAGSGDEKEITNLKDIIKRAGLAKKVILKGRVSGKIKEELLKNAACVVVPSRFETYSLVSLEAMAYGAPLVCFGIEGLSWIPKKAVQKVKPFNVEGLAKAIEAVVTNNVLAEDMIKEGNKYAKQFTWDAIAEQYKKYIEHILKN